MTMMVYDSSGKGRKERNLFHKASQTLIVLLKLNLVYLWKNKSNQTSKMLSSRENVGKTTRWQIKMFQFCETWKTFVLPDTSFVACLTIFSLP